MINWIKQLVEDIKILVLKSRGYIPFDGLIPEVPPKKVRMFGGYVDDKASRIREILKEKGRWKSFLSIFTDEQQRQKGLETMRCTIQGEMNKISAYMNLCIENKLFSEDNIKWLNDIGYIVNGKFNPSERYIAKLSWTSKNGNLDSRVLGTIHDYGLVPESMCKWEDWMDTWDKYYSPIDKELIYNVGYEFKRRFEFLYQIIQVPEFKDALWESPIGSYVYGGYNVVNGVVQYSSMMSNHKICIYDIDDYNEIEDSYNPMLKKFVKNYPFYAGANTYTGKRYSYGYKICFLENIIKKKMIKVIKQKNQKDYYAIDVEAGEINAFGGWGSYVKFLNAKWCEEVLEVDEIKLYLRQKYGKGFVIGEEIGVVK